MQARRLARTALLGAAGGIAGLMAMRAAMKLSSRVVERSPLLERPLWPKGPEEISLIGTHPKDEEPSTAALGRVVFEKVLHREPSEKAHTRLSYGVHWGYGSAMATAYALARERLGPGAGRGMLFGLWRWLFSDEMMVPLLGLSKSSFAHSAAVHLEALAQHLAFGAAVEGTISALAQKAG